MENDDAKVLIIATDHSVENQFYSLIYLDGVAFEIETYIVDGIAHYSSAYFEFSQPAETAIAAYEVDPNYSEPMKSIGQTAGEFEFTSSGNACLDAATLEAKYGNEIAFLYRADNPETNLVVQGRHCGKAEILEIFPFTLPPRGKN